MTVNCRCESCQAGSTYWCVKSVWLHGGNLNDYERFLVGDLPRAQPSVLVRVLDAEGRRTEREWARLNGIRWLVDFGDERLEIVT